MWQVDDWFDAPLAQRSRRACRIALVCYLVPVMVATHWPRLAFEGSGTIDKFVHFVGFGVLAWLFLTASLFRRPVLNLALAAFWVYFDEVTQAIEILGRTFSGYDMAAGWLGCGVAGLLWMGLRQRAPRGTDERLDDLTAERLLYATGAGWIRVGATVACFIALFAGLAALAGRHATGEAPGLGALVFPAGLGFLVGAGFGTVGAFVRSYARVESGRIDAWTGAVEREGVAFRQRDHAPALRWPTMIGGLAIVPSWYTVVAVERILFGELTDEKMADFAGFAVLRPIFAAMLAFAAAVVASGVMVGIRRAKRGFRAQRQRP